MRIPKTPPDVNEVLSSIDVTKRPNIFEILSRSEVVELVRRVNDGYVHWDKLRRYPMPPGITPQIMWAAIVISRMQQFREVDLSSMHGNVKFWTPPRHQAWLHRIDTDGGGVIGSASREPVDGKERFLFNSLMEEAIASSQLEGASTTRVVAKKMLRTGRKPKDKHEQMILNNYNAILEIRNSRNDPLTPTFICHIHEIITDKTLNDPSRAGSFRTSDDLVDVVDNYTQEVLFTPPTAHSIKRRIDEVCDFANDASGVFIHPVQKAILLHFMIGFIHPFVDGNGRTARALFYWYMLKHGYWIFEFLPISRIVLDSPAKYVLAYLYAETDGYDLTYFMHYHLRIIDRAVREMHEYVASQQTLISQTRTFINSMDLNNRQIQVVNRAIQEPHSTFTIKEHAGTHRIAIGTARNDFLGLVSHSILEQRKRGKTFVFLPSESFKSRFDKSAFRRVSTSTKNAPVRTRLNEVSETPTTTTTPAPEPSEEVQLDLFKSY